jgi:hypothetical protein
MDDLDVAVAQIVYEALKPDVHDFYIARQQGLVRPGFFGCHERHPPSCIDIFRLVRKFLLCQLPMHARAARTPKDRA